MASESPTIKIEKPQIRPWREVAILMLMIMEVSWVTPWFRSLTPATYAIEPVLAFLVLLSLMAVSHLSARSMEALRLRADLRRWVTIGLLVMSVLVGLRVLLYPHERLGFLDLLNRPLRSMVDLRSIIPDEFVIILVVLFGWWRGISLAQEHIEPSSVMGYFRLGIFMFLGYIIFNTLVTGETPGSFVYLFFFCSLIAMSTARISVLRTLRGGKQSSFDRRWFAGVTVASAGVVVLAAGLAEALSDNLGWFGIIAMGVFGILAVVVWALVSPLLALAIYLMRNMQGDLPAVTQLVETFERFQKMLQGLLQQVSAIVGQPKILEVLSRMLPYLRTIFLWGVILAVAAGVLIWVVMQLRKENQRKQPEGDEQSILERGELWRMLQAFLRQRWGNLMQDMANAVDFRRRQRARAAARIRQIYADLLDLGEELGCARPEAQTPLEFMPSLEVSIPTVEAELEMITSAYLKVRYGQLPENRQEVEEVEGAWERVGIKGKEILAERAHQKSPPAAVTGKGTAKLH
jgi:hypothetical protein